MNSNPYPYTRGVNFNLSYPIFNRFQRENQVPRRRSIARTRKPKSEDERLGAQQTIITRHRSMRNAEEQMRVQQSRMFARAKRIFA